MSYFTFTPAVTVLSSTNDSYVTYENCQPLWLSKRITNDTMQSQNLVMELKVPFCIEQIRSVVLELPVCRFFSNYSDFENIIRISALSPMNQYAADSNSRTVIERYIDYNSVMHQNLNLDLTELLSDWDCSPDNPCRIMLEITIPGLALQIMNLSSASPKLHLQGMKAKTPSPQPSHIGHHEILSLGSMKERKLFLAPGDAVAYDHIYIATSNLKYDEETYQFRIHNTGYYYVQWIINLLGCCSLPCISIGIRNEQSKEILDFHAPCVMPAQICGQHVIHVESADSWYSIINNSEATLQLSNIDSQASLVVFQL